MSKKLVHLVAFVAGSYFSLVRADVDEHFKIVLLTENYPPYNMSINDKNFARGDNIDGVSTDIIREVFKRAGINYALTLRFPWKRVYKLALEKSNYGVFSTSRLPEREHLFKWVGPLAKDDWVFLAKADSSMTLNQVEDAKQYRLGGYKDDAITNYLETKGLDLSNSLSDKENVKKLMASKIDLWATGDLAGRYIAQQEGVENLRRVITFRSGDLYLALNKDIPDVVVHKLQTVLNQMKQDKTVDNIVNSYL